MARRDSSVGQSQGKETIETSNAEGWTPRLHRDVCPLLNRGFPGPTATHLQSAKHMVYPPQPSTRAATALRTYPDRRFWRFGVVERPKVRHESGARARRHETLVEGTRASSKARSAYVALLIWMNRHGHLSHLRTGIRVRSLLALCLHFWDCSKVHMPEKATKRSKGESYVYCLQPGGRGTGEFGGKGKRSRAHRARDEYIAPWLSCHPKDDVVVWRPGATLLMSLADHYFHG